VHLNWLAVLVATVAIFILGWLWYSPLLFYKPWMRARGLDPVAAMAGAKMPAGTLVMEFARCLVLSTVLAIFVRHLELQSVFAAIHFGLLLWIGVPLVLLSGSVLWEKVSPKVAAIHAGDWLVKMLVVPLIVALWR
jgi:hypothetical protein